MGLLWLIFIVLEMKNSIFLVLNWIMHSVRSTIRASQNRNRNNMYHHRSSNVCSNKKEYGRSSSNNQCMSSPMQLLNPEAEQHLAKVGEGFFWMMSAAQEKNLASLSVETLELVFTTVDTLRMLVLCAQVNISATDLEINYSHTMTTMVALLFFPFSGLVIVGLTRPAYIATEGDHLRICVEIIEGQVAQESVVIISPGINGSATSGYPS